MYNSFLLLNVMSCHAHAVILTFDPFITLNIIVHQVSRDQRLHEIWAKSSNLRLN